MNMVSETKQKILKLLAEERYPAQIARELKISKASVSQHIRELKSAGVLQEKERITMFKEYKMAENANKILENSKVSNLTRSKVGGKKPNSYVEIKPNSSNIGGQEPNSEPNSSHILSLSEPAASQAEDAAGAECWRSNKLAVEAWHEGIPDAIKAISRTVTASSNLSYYVLHLPEGYTLEVYAKAVVLRAAPTLQSKGAIQAQLFKLECERKAFKALMAASVAFGIPYKQINGVVIARVLSHEIAQTDNDLAGRVTSTGGSTEGTTYVALLTDPLTSELRVIADMSVKDKENAPTLLGKELEAIMPRWSGHDSDRLNEFLKDVNGEDLQDFWDDNGIEGTRAMTKDVVLTGWGTIKATVAELAELQAKQTTQQAHMDTIIEKYVVNIDAHASFIYDALKRFEQQIPKNPAPQPPLHSRIIALFKGVFS